MVRFRVGSVSMAMALATAGALGGGRVVRAQSVYPRGASAGGDLEPLAQQIAALSAELERLDEQSRRLELEEQGVDPRKNGAWRMRPFLCDSHTSSWTGRRLPAVY